MRKPIAYKKLNWEYEIITETESVKVRGYWFGKEVQTLNIYTSDGNKIMSFGYPTNVIISMEVIYNYIDDYIIRMRKNKLNKLNHK